MTNEVRIECDVQTGEVKEVPLTQEEIDAALARKAIEDAYNTLDARAQRSIDTTDRLLFEVNFDQENRIRALEGKAAVTKIQYRDALIERWKLLNA
jgi:hypothetical protein